MTYGIADVLFPKRITVTHPKFVGARDEQRERLFAYIKAHPDCYAKDMQRDTGASSDTIAVDLAALWRKNRIISTRSYPRMWRVYPQPAIRIIKGSLRR